MRPSVAKWRIDALAACDNCFDNCQGPMPCHMTTFWLYSFPFNSLGLRPQLSLEDIYSRTYSIYILL